MMSFIKHRLADPVLVCGGIFLFSALSLMAALIAQYIYGLEPCVLCIYQRWPFGITAVLAVIGLGMLYHEKHSKAVAVIVFICGLIYLAGGIIAFYHHGVEQHWWASFLEGCAVSFDTADLSSLMASIENAGAARCDEIPWADPVFNLSMAAWNMIISPIAAVKCMAASVMITRKANGAL